MTLKTKLVLWRNLTHNLSLLFCTVILPKSSSSSSSSLSLLLLFLLLIDGLAERVARLQAENSRLRCRRTCRNCRLHRFTHIAVPCGHPFCEECLQHMPHCSVCDSTITAAHRSFFQGQLMPAQMKMASERVEKPICGALWFGSFSYVDWHCWWFSINCRLLLLSFKKKKKLASPCQKMRPWLTLTLCIVPCLHAKQLVL